MREAQGLTLRQLAAKSGTNPAYISQVERGKREPSQRWLHAVTTALADNLSAGAGAA